MTHLDDNIALITGAVVELEQRVLCRISEAGCARPGG
jgi:hypothetical protein